MYLKSEKELFRRRHNFPWGWILLVLLLVGGAIYAIYSMLPLLAEQLGLDAFSVVVATATPMPTPTPAAGYYAALAEEAVMEGSVARAVAAYQQSLDMEPNQPELYLDLARLLIYDSQPERGLEMARQALIRQPENARAWALLGLAYDWLGLTGQAVAYCQHAVELDPTLPEAYAYLAEAYIDDGQWSAANATIATAARLAPDNVDVLRNQAYVLENQGNYYGAMEGYREALPANDMILQLYLSIGRNAGALGDLVRARQAYESAVDVDPNHALARDRLGLTQLLMGDYDNARINLLASLEADPFLPDAYAHLGTLYFQQRAYEDAIEMFGPAVEYGEARSRRRTTLFIITLEPTDSVGAAPQGPEIAYAQFVHPIHFDAPLRGEFKMLDAGGLEEGVAPVTGQIRLNVISGLYSLNLTGMPPAPAGRVYVGWFRQLLSPEGNLIHTDPLFPTPDGRVDAKGATGTVKGPSVEVYYSYALCYYLLDECDLALPLIDTALRLDPGNETALQTRDLCR